MRTILSSNHKFLLLGCLLSLLFSNELKATHATGADMTYVCLGNNQYKITITFYRDCAGVPEDNSYFINLSSVALGVDTNFIAPKGPQPNGQVITQDCPTSLSRCLGGTAVGIRKWRYEKIITLPGQSNDWIIGWRECNRNFAITTVNNPGSYCTYIEAHIDNSNGLCNNSPVFSNIPIVFACIGQDFNYNQGALDSEGDSLFYELVNPLENKNVLVPLLPPYTATFPLSSSTPFTINAASGAIKFRPNLLQVGILAVLVKEYRNGIQIGSVMRDFQFYIQNCKTNNVPTLSGFNGTNDYTLNMCLGDSVCFFINSFDTDTFQRVYINSNVLQSLNNVSFSDDTAFRPTATICYKPDTAESLTTPQFFTITVYDEFCPNAAAQTFTYTINVHDLDIDMVTSNITCALHDGEIAPDLTPNLPGTTFLYLWNNGATTKKIKNLEPGTYSVSVISSVGCIETRSATITGPTENVTCNFSVTNQTTCVPCNGAIINDSINKPYTYLWSDGSTNASLQNACAGTYTVTSTDIFGCTLECNFTILDQTPSISCTASNSANTFCNSNCNGTATALASGGTAYTYLWNNGQTNDVATGLCSGTYTVTVTDASGCTSSCQTILTDNTDQPGCTVQKTDVVCKGALDGTATANVSGGIAPFDYLWSNGNTNQTANSLAPGSYSVTVTDSHGCTSQCSANISDGPDLSIAISGTPSQCNSCNGTTTTTLTGGVAPVTYLWNNGNTNSNLSALCSGTYSIVATDANGCTVSETIVIIDQSETISCTISKTNVTCNGAQNGTASVNVTQGTAPFTYLWSNGKTTSGISGLGVGTFTVTVSNINGCSSSCQVIITQPVKVGCNITVAANALCGACTGSLVADQQNTVGTVTFLWSNGATTKTITNLCAGTYTVTVSRTNGCSSSCSAVVGNTLIPITISKTIVNNNACNNTCNGSVSVTATGGTSYTYLWSNGATTATAAQLCQGFYTVTVTDISGCTGTTSAEVKGKTTNVLATITNQTIPKCGTPCIGKLKVNGSGGTQYSYIWSTNPAKTAQTISNICPGTYTVTVTDVSGCTATASIQLFPYVNTLNCSVLPTMNTSCNLNTCNGTGTLSVANGSGNYTYLWNTIPVQTTSVGTGLCSGSYVVTVTDISSNCTSSCLAKLQDIPSSMICGVQQLQSISCNGGSNGSIKVNVTNPGPNLVYLWSNGATTATVTGLAKGTYRVTVTDGNGCTTSCSRIVSEPSVLKVVATSSSAKCLQPCNGKIQLAVSGGIAPYVYVWSNGSNTSNKDTTLCPGTYTVTVTDARGCTKSISVTISNEAYVCTTFLSGNNQSYWNPAPGGNAVSNYLNANFTTLFPTGILLKGSCGTAKQITLTTVAAVKEIQKGTGAPTTITQNYNNPLLSTLNNSLAANVTTLWLNINFDLADPNWAPASTVNFKDLVVDSGPLTGLTVEQVYQQAVNALTGCGSVYTNSILRTYCSLINASWNLGSKNNNVLKCPVNNGCGAKGNGIPLMENDELLFNVFPNPNDGNFELQFLAESGFMYEITMFENSGRKVFEKNGTSVTGINHINIFNENFAKGFYILEFKVAGEKRELKLLIE